MIKKLCTIFSRILTNACKKRTLYVFFYFCFSVLYVAREESYLLPALKDWSGPNGLELVAQPEVPREPCAVWQQRVKAQRYGLIVSNVCDWTERNCGKCLRCAGGTRIPSFPAGWPLTVFRNVGFAREWKRALQLYLVGPTVKLPAAKFDKYPTDTTVYCLGSETRNFPVNGEIGNALCTRRYPQIRSELHRNRQDIL